MKPFLLLLLIVLFSPPALAQVNTGDPAPGFTYTSLDGDEISLADFEGKVVYIFFYGAGCPHCLDNGPITENDIYQPHMEDTGFVALGLDTWNLSRSANQSFKSETGITYTLLLNARQSLEDYYGNTSSYDRSVVISKEGEIAYKGTGFVDTDTDQVIAVIEEELSKTITSAGPTDQSPERISLAQNYPNPFNPVTTISYALDKPAQVSLKIYNMLGAEVATLVNERQSAGQKTVSWNALSSSGSAVPSGMYIYQLRTEDQVLTKKMTLIK
ncbi:redoxin family protein [Gracilimonas sediminicola]|uniref:Redoxin family protein n=1 Tax=Gracilimonas sediminicola TaxID=2952158 RepID=A0A9X2RC73_9BACT|nr:redoxin family protein [Gracilimonas sediminicola]MCP9290725.1 redoxin family protein [Gracilimonas sediminicola]